jgi:PKD repeat protein
MVFEDRTRGRAIQAVHEWRVFADDAAEAVRQRASPSADTDGWLTATAEGVYADAMRVASTVPLSTALLLIAASAPARATTVNDPRFVLEVIHNDDGMISIEFAPDGRLYVCKKIGQVLTFAPDGSGGFAEPTQFLALSDVAYTAESGLLGMVLDPDFAQNRYMYLFYTRSGDQRLIRVTANAALDAAVPGSELELLAGLPRAVDFHKAGDIQFRPGDPNAIYMAIGDDGNRGAAQDLNRYEGKILRVSKSDGRGLADNPFFGGDVGAVRARVWAYGLRNPFRFAFHPAGGPADVLYVSENGDSLDRLSRVTRGSNGAWSEMGDAGGFLSPADPGHRVLHTEPATLVGITIDNGGVFAAEDAPGSSTLLLSNGLTGTIVRYRLTGAALDGVELLDSGQPLVSGLLFAGAVDMTIGPDGALYYTNCAGDASGNGAFELGRVRLALGTPPVARFDASAISGTAPLTVTFNDQSSDSDGSIRAWSWTFGDGASSTEPSPTHEFTEPGIFTVTLQVTDDTGQRGMQQTVIEVTQEVSLHLHGRVVDGRDLDGAGLAAATELRLYDGDVARALAIAGGGGNTIRVAAGGRFDFEGTVNTTARYVLVSAGEPEPDGVQPAIQAVRVASGAIERALSFYLSDTAMRGRVRDTRGEPAVIDLGTLMGNTLAPYALAGGRDVLPGATRAQSGVAHRVVTDELGYYYVPIRSGDRGMFAFDLLADTGRDRYTGAGFSVSISRGALFEHDVEVGLIGGGLQCDDLSAIPETADVDYERDIQPLWSRLCVGCHTDVAENSGGLDLQAGSRERLVSIESAFVPGQYLIEPAAPERSYLFEKINCQDPQDGTRMRPTDALPLEDQALVRDFIAQLPPPPDDQGAAGSSASAGRGAVMDHDAGASGRDASAEEPDAGGGNAEALAAAASGGCGCRLAPGTTPAPLLGLLLYAVCALRRRARASRAAPKKR